MVRHRVRAGVTGWAQMHGARRVPPMSPGAASTPRTLPPQVQFDIFMNEQDEFMKVVLET